MHREVEQVAGDAVYGLPSICLQFYLFTPARRALSFSSIPWETLAFRIVLVCRCAHDQQRQRNAHQCFQLGDQLFRTGRCPSGHMLCWSLYSFLHDKPLVALRPPRGLDA